MKTVLTFGTFDIFHPWHEYYLHEAKKHGDKLVTIIALDQTVHKLKGKLPKNNEKQRKKTVEESKISNLVLLWVTENYYNCIIEQQADVICLGYDQSHLADWLENFLKTKKIEAKIVRIAPFHEDTYKSSKLW